MSEKTVFVSYSSKDRVFVNEIVNELQQMGISCWKAPEMIPAGSSYAREIPKAIQNCDVFLLMLSKTSQDSIWVEKEIDNAISNRKNIIPFQLDEEPLNDTFRFYLNNVQMICYHENAKQAMKDLKQELSMSILGITYEETNQDSSIPEQKTDGHNQFKRPSKTLSFGTIPRKSGSRSKNSNSLRVNRIPIECQYCGCDVLENTTLGTYCCTRCNKNNYDDFQTIRNYLEQAGSASALVIERETGVPRRTINYFFEQEYLEIPIHSAIRVPCSKCGAPIRTGILCDDCKKSQKMSDSKSDQKATWHTGW